MTWFQSTQLARTQEGQIPTWLYPKAFLCPSGETEEDDDTFLVAMGRCDRETVAFGHETRGWSRRTARPFCEVL
jgi:hypothetical protein